MTGIYRFADIALQFSALHPEVHAFCSAYADPGPAVFSVATTQEDIDFEREKSAREDKIEGLPIRSYADAYLETLAIYRKIAEKMPGYDTFLFHGSAIAVDGQAYLFTAKSGTGKSTHTRLWRELLGGQAVMVNDDKPLIRVCEDGASVVYGTPWDGKHRLSSNISIPLKAVCILERAKENSICGITKSEALPMLLQQTYRPADPMSMKKTLELIERWDVKLYRLSCNMDLSAAELSFNTMKG